MARNLQKQLIIVVAIFILLFSSCEDDLKIPPQSSTATEISENMGRISIALEKTDGRTLLPQTPEFSRYAIKFQYLAGGVGDINETIVSLPYEKELLPGDWRITVTGHVYIESVEGLLDGHYPAATGEVDINIKAGVSNPVNVDLNRANTGAKGVFQYEIGLPSNDVMNANLRILRMNKSEILSFNLKESAAGTIAMDNGYYFMQVNIFTGRLRTKTELIHIYSGHTTIASGKAWGFDIEEGVYLSLKDISYDLSTAQVNTVDNPYQIKLITDFESLSVSDEFLGNLYSVLNGRYVSIDLSESVNVVDFGVTTSYSVNRSRLVSVILPDGLTQIGDNAFSGCSSLTNITIPDSVSNIGGYAFNGCSSLTSIIIPDSLTSIGSSAFNGCNKLTSVFYGGINSASWNQISIASLNTILTNADRYYYSESNYDDVNTYWRFVNGVPEIWNVMPLIFSLINNDTAYSVSKGTSYIAVVVIPSVYNGLPVTAITENGFQNYSNMTSITIPSSVTSIGNNAFSDCSGLTNITIPNSVTSIGSSAFTGCSGLKTITLPFIGNIKNGTTNTHFGYIFGALNYANQNSLIPISLKTVVMSGGNSVYANAFYGCSSLTNIIIPSSVTSIGSSAFGGCDGLTSLTIPFIGNTLNGTTNTHFGYIFGASSYNNQDSIVPVSLKTLNITGGNSINSNAFNGCSSLTNITIPNSVTSIGYGAFLNCNSLTSVNLPNGITSIGDLAFYSCYNLISITIPSSITSIGKQAFQGCYNLMSITIHEGLKNIGSNAFYGCISLMSIMIPSSVTSIDLGGCINISIDVDINNQNYSTQDGILYDKLKTQIIHVPQLVVTGSITIPDGVTSIGDHFSGVVGLTSIIISSSVIYIGSFSGCDNLTSINVNVNNPNYSSQNGILYDKLKTQILHVPQLITGSITIPDSITSIGTWFTGKTGLTSITLGSGVMSIDYNAFYNCNGLTSVIIGNNVKSIAPYAFIYCTRLTSITLGSSLTGIGYAAFAYCYSLTSITIPISVTSIGGYAFYDCSSLMSITMSSVTSIGDHAFAHCYGLTSVTLGTITSANFSTSAPFPGNLRTVYFAAGGGAGTYTRAAGSDSWVKQ